MPRYFFHTANGGIHMDKEGDEFPDDQTALATAIKHSGEIFKDEHGEIAKAPIWQMHVVRDDGIEVYALTLTMQSTT